MYDVLYAFMHVNWSLYNHAWLLYREMVIHNNFQVNNHLKIFYKWCGIYLQSHVIYWIMIWPIIWFSSDKTIAHLSRLVCQLVCLHLYVGSAHQLWLRVPAVENLSTCRFHNTSGVMTWLVQQHYTQSGCGITHITVYVYRDHCSHNLVCMNVKTVSLLHIHVLSI